jgi:hypothetical protein
MEDHQKSEETPKWRRNLGTRVTVIWSREKHGMSCLREVARELLHRSSKTTSLIGHQHRVPPEPLARSL